MAKKTTSIAEEISALENDLSHKNEEIQTYEKSINKLLKSLFGMDKKNIDKLIADSQKKSSDDASNVTLDEGVDAEISKRNSASEGHGPSFI